MAKAAIASASSRTTIGVFGSRATKYTVSASFLTRKAAAFSFSINAWGLAQMFER